MAIHKYTTAAGRINKLKGEILAHARVKEVLGITGMQRKMPPKNGKTVIFRRWLPYGATAGAIVDGLDPQNILIPKGSGGVDPTTAWLASHVTAEGVTPSADVMTPYDVPVTLVQYAALYALTDDMQDLYEDDVGAEMKQQTGERAGLIREMVRYGALKAATNKFYAGGTSRVTVDEALSLTFLRKIARSLYANHGEKITRILAPTPNISTSPVEAAFLVFCHTDCEADIRDLTGFTPTAEYGTRTPVHECEIGSTETFRFITSADLMPIPDAGALVGATGLYSTTGTNIDVYPVIVAAKDAWGQVTFRGMNALDVTMIKPGKKDKGDPLGQRGYVGCKFRHAAAVYNQGWMALAEVGVTDL